MDAQGLSVLKKMNKDAQIFDTSLQLNEQTLEEHAAQINAMQTDDVQLQAIQEKLIEQLMVDTQSAQDLMTKCPTLVLRAQGKEAALEEDANRSGIKKIKEDFRAQKKKAAKAELQTLRAKREQLREDRYGKELVVEQRSGVLHDLVHKIFNGKEEDTVDKKGNVTKKGRRTKQMDSTFLSLMGDLSKDVADSGVADDKHMGGLPIQRRNVSFGPDGAKLNGYCFEAKNYDPQTGKVLIYYTGSGEPGSAEAGVGATIQEYLRQGFKVYQVDYRGYGTSGPDGFALSEAGFYQDGMTIYQSVLQDAQVDPSQVVMHGYSLGGAVASYVAGKVAQDTAKRHKGKENVPPNEMLGGLILESPMASMMKASIGSDGETFGKVEGYFGSLAGGSYSAEEHLDTLHQVQPDIPIMFVGGGDGDFLGLGKTMIHDKFRDKNPIAVVHAKQGHLEGHMTADDLRQFRTRYGIADPRILSTDELTAIRRERQARMRQEAEQRRLQRQQQAGQG